MSEFGIKETKEWPLLSSHEVDKSMVEPAKAGEQLMHFKLYSYRYFNVFVFVISALGNNLIVHTTTPIVAYLEKLYPDYGAQLISMCALIFYILHPPMAFVSNWILDTKGLKFGITIGAATIIVGTGLRCLIKESFAFVILGQFINALGNCFITNSPSKVAACWFPPRHRPAVTAISTFAVLASAALGIVIPSIFVSKVKNAESDVYNLMVAEFIMVAAIMSFNIIFFRGEPPTAPSFSAQKKKEPFQRSLKSMFSNRNYLLLLGFITLLLGTINAYFVTIGFMIQPFGFGPSDASMIGLFSIAFGFVGSIVGATVLKKTRKYKPIMFIGTLLGGLCLLIELAFLSQGNDDSYRIAAYFMSGLSGFFAYPVFSTALEFGCEIAFPNGEATIAGFLLAGSQVFGFILGLLMTIVIDGEEKSNSYIGAIIYLVLVFMSIIPLNFTTQDLRRSQQEIQGTLTSHPILNQGLKDEMARDYVIDNKASQIVQEEIVKRFTVGNSESNKTD